MEAAIITGGVIIIFGILKGIKETGYKCSKRKLWKALHKGFIEVNGDIILETIDKLRDFDKKNKRNKLNKYINKILAENRKNDLPNLNSKNVRGLSRNPELIHNIFDESEESILDEEDIIDKKIDVVNSTLTDIERKRKDIIIRKNEIRHNMINKNKKLRRNSGKMG